MKIITLEEHFQFAEIKKAVAKFLPSSQQSIYDPPTQLEDLGVGRLKDMDAMGIDVQVLSHTASGIPLIPASEAVPLARAINDQLAEVIYTHPDRFAGFATLPTPDPEAAATLYSVDYPFHVDNQARVFLENAPISPADKEKIAHSNAERLLKL